MLLRGHSLLQRDQFFTLLDLCRSAGEIIRGHYESTAQRQMLRSKHDKSPLTQADLASHDLLAAGLASITPGIPVLSEESHADDISHRHQWPVCWMVDPLDGTKEFLDGTGEFSVNIALIESGRPSVGLIYQPMTRKCYLGVVGDGAYRCEYHMDSWNTEALSTRLLPESELVLFASRRHQNERLSTCLAFLSERFQIERRNSGSALKFCDLAEGLGDVYPRFSPCSEWDVAAGDALVTAAGGLVLGTDGEPLRYNARDSLLSPHFVAVGDPQDPLWPELLAELPGAESLQ